MTIKALVNAFLVRMHEDVLCKLGAPAISGGFQYAEEGGISSPRAPSTWAAQTPRTPWLQSTLHLISANKYFSSTGHIKSPLMGSCSIQEDYDNML